MKGCYSDCGLCWHCRKTKDSGARLTAALALLAGTNLATAEGMIAAVANGKGKA